MRDDSLASLPTSDVSRIETLRAKYRLVWDVHQVIADHNVKVVHAGKQPSYEQLLNEKRAAQAVRRARDALRRELERVTA